MLNATLGILSENRFRKAITLPNINSKYLKKNNTPKHTTKVRMSKSFFTLLFSVFSIKMAARYETNVVPTIKKINVAFQLPDLLPQGLVFRLQDLIVPQYRFFGP
jgi:hypothetical protein